VYLYNNASYTINIYDEYGSIIKTIGTGDIGSGWDELNDPTWGDVVPVHTEVKINIDDTWKNGVPYINIGDSWKTALKVYISLHGNATWESVKDMTWNDIIDETWDYQRQSWREIV
jgi:hypothetical protein